MNAPRLQLRDVPPRTAFALEQAGVHPLLARLLAARGVRQADELDDGLAQLLPPRQRCAAPTPRRGCWPTRSRSAQRLCVVADYDCDGATACAVALRGLRAARRRAGHAALRGARPRGARLRPDAGHRRPGAGASGPTLLVTVDNGIASLDGVAHARALGLQVLVTDHHLPAKDGEQVLLPEADVIVNPNQPGCGFASKALAGVGVMFYVLLATARRAARARRLRRRGAAAARRAARPGGAGHGGRRGAGSTPTTAAWWRRA